MPLLLVQNSANSASSASSTGNPPEAVTERNQRTAQPQLSGFTATKSFRQSRQLLSSFGNQLLASWAQARRKLSFLLATVKSLGLPFGDNSNEIRGER
jgi:hypothetical protein